VSLFRRLARSSVFVAACGGRVLLSVVSDRPVSESIHQSVHQLDDPLSHS
jgi:hypothetical protein